MALDSDVEAYLNQLSKKTYSLKRDEKSWQDPPSSGPSSVVNQLSDDLSVSDMVNLPDLPDKASHQHRRKAVDSTNDIAALSDKYSDSRSKKRYPQDRLSTLEQKYLRKNVPKTVENTGYLERHKHGNSSIDLENGKHEENSILNNDVKSVTSPKEKLYVQSDTSSVDEELANYLNETSLMESQHGKSESISKFQSCSEWYEDSMDEILNVNNLMTVDDILGQITDDDSSKPSSETKSKSRVVLGKNKVPLFVKGSESNPDIIKSEENNILTKKTEYYNSTHHGDSTDDECYKKPVGILLAQASNNIFRSSRRKSSIEFNVENLARLIPRQKERSEPEIVSEESISSSFESNVVESVVKTEPSEEDQSVEEYIAGQSKDRRMHQHPATQSQMPSSKNLYESIESTQSRLSSHRENDLYNTATKSSALSHRNSDELLHVKESHKSNGTRDKIKRDKSSKSSGENVLVEKSKHSKIYRTSTSDSVSSESSDSEMDKGHRTRRHRRRRRRRSSSSYDRWYVPAYYRHPRIPCCHHMCASSPGILPTNSIPSVLEGFRPMPGTVEVDQLMRQQVELTRQFLESQQTMYQAYTATFTSNHRYTSIRATEKYIKQKQPPPLTFKEAYRLVKEEMEASER